MYGIVIDGRIVHTFNTRKKALGVGKRKCLSGTVNQLSVVDLRADVVARVGFGRFGAVRRKRYGRVIRRYES